MDRNDEFFGDDEEHQGRPQRQLEGYEPVAKAIAASFVTVVAVTAVYFAGFRFGFW